METDRVFSSREKARALEAMLAEPGTPLKVREIARAVGVTPGFISKYAATLRKQGIVTGTAVDQANPSVRLLKAFMNVNRLLEADAAGAIRKHLPQAKGIGVYGSWLTGTNHQRSDLDLWVKAATRPPAIAAAKAQKELSQKLGTDVQLTVLDKEQLESLRTRGNPFYNSLYNSFTLWGEPID